MHVLLVGGTGFLGRHTARTLRDAGHRVSTLARGTEPPVAGVEPLLADRRRPDELARALEGRRYDFTVDFAAYDASDVERLLQVRSAALGRYVLISSGQVYLVTAAARRPYREEDSEKALMPEPAVGTPDHAQWTYGVGKRRAEEALLALRDSHGVRGVILRLPVVLGEEDRTLRLWAYLERIRDGGPIVLPEGGRQMTRFIYSGDVARAALHLLDHGPPRAAIYNLCQPDLVPLRDFLERLARLAGMAPTFVEASWDEIREARLEPSFSPYSGRWVSVLDPSRASADWGFAGSRLDEYLPAVVRWHLEQPPERHHAGYAQRESEARLASRLLQARR